MKVLSIIRHATAEAGSHSRRDFDRALSARGQKDAHQLAKVVDRLDLPVDHIICSAAQRTRQTAAAILKKIDTVAEPVWSDAAYLASVDMLLILLKNAPEKAEHVALIGHNPGVEQLVARLCNSGSGRVNLIMAAGTLAHFNLQILEWNQLDWGCAQLVAFVSPTIYALES